ncbi:hypothetical protein LB545_03605 [Mesorhizobium sp. BR1-1-6]|uniref:hypothetical protein n=1 Tax=Mesorhizobium sp. BR1-1-6 TaxID=2876648 RepID=UPI001CD0631A|nr:hypothetical protein [Mesorhizobium sp. BR1-1-6]MBZ9893417.1 hypothetical protein [Mesorhizobium sp. BR1-1-6]
MRTLENDLIMPALNILADAAQPEIGISTAELARKLREQVEPTAEDREILQGRTDDRLSQVIRNLVSHRTLERRGLAIYYKNPITGRGLYRLTEMGNRTLNEARNDR